MRYASPVRWEGQSLLCPYPYLSPGFQPWEPCPERFALTRHMNVRSMNNTRSSGLEMLKGRQIERTNNAKVVPVVARLNCAL
jgi:hypothetical protein